MTNIDSVRQYFLSHQDEMLEGVDILWGEYLDYYYLMCKKQSIGDKSFYKELQNDPRSTDDCIFQDIGYWKSLPDLDEMEVVLYIDTAINAGKRNDYSAITILGKQEKTAQMLVLDGSIMNKQKRWYHDLSNMKKICYIGMLLSFILLLISKHACINFDSETKYIYIDWESVSDIVSGLCLGFIASAVVALFIENSNARLLDERNKYVKQVLLSDYSRRINDMLGEFQNGGDRRIDYLPYHYDHLTWSIENRIRPFADQCEEIINKYSSIYTCDEIDAIITAKVCANSIYLYLDTIWRDKMNSISKDMSLLYWHKTTGDPLPKYIKGRRINDIEEQAMPIAQDLHAFMDSLFKIKRIMPYLFTN